MFCHCICSPYFYAHTHLHRRMHRRILFCSVLFLCISIMAQKQKNMHFWLSMIHMIHISDVVTISSIPRLQWYIQIHMIDFVLAVEQPIEEDVISCLKNGTHIKIGDDNDRDVDDCVYWFDTSVKVGWYPSAINCCHCHTIIIIGATHSEWPISLQ